MSKLSWKSAARGGSSSPSGRLVGEVLRSRCRPAAGGWVVVVIVDVGTKAGGGGEWGWEYVEVSRAQGETRCVPVTRNVRCGGRDRGVYLCSRIRMPHRCCCCSVVVLTCSARWFDCLGAVRRLMMRVSQVGRARVASTPSSPPRRARRVLHSVQSPRIFPTFFYTQ